MAFASFNEFLAMGGHGPYVWTSWAVTAALLGGIVIHARSERRQLLRNLQRRARRERRLAGGRAPVSHQRGGHVDDT
ncbi:heme exporter protein CcmD [Halomonas sp. EGI 63088]|uniref:Heme exporter protein D n=2 Tax=Halomonadaceae TaxID=28256 RepID=A0ABS9RQB4_9GAMM|nr:heme exporter protein CcmD [Halomonas flagellata]MCH4562032.1 heme exporter protein CcmD [Halomonas flagellata]PXX98250.1 heme exporter protein CcmD [Halomonas sp. LBP4]